MMDDEEQTAGSVEARASLRSRTFELVKKLFEDNAWPYQIIDAYALKTNLGGEHTTFAAMLSVTEHWVVTSVNPFVRKPERGFGPAALHLMCTANHLMNLVKVGRDPDGDAFLAVELPAEGFCSAHLFDSLASLTHYADELHIPLLQSTRIDAHNRTVSADIHPQDAHED